MHARRLQLRRLDQEEVGEQKTLTDILILQLMSQPDPLRLMLDRLAVDNRRLELLHNAAVNRVTLRATKPSVSHKTHRRNRHNRLTKSSMVHFEARSTTGAE